MPMALAIALVLVATTTSAPATITPAGPSPFRVTARALDLRVDYDEGSLSGTETLRLHNAGRGEASEVSLLLNRLMTVSRVTDGEGAARSFRQSAVVFEDDPRLQVDHAVVSLPAPVAPGDSLTLVVHYAGTLTGYTETGSLYIRDRIGPDFTIIREDAYAYPVVGVPSRARNREAGYDSFMFAARITVPVGLVVATGGEPIEPVRRDSLVTWEYHGVAPAPFLNIAIAPYRTIDRGGARIFYFPQDSVGAATIERAISGAMTRLAGWYGPLGGEPHLTVIEIPEGWGSQASLWGGIIQTAEAFRDPAQLVQVYHELTHLWNVPDLDRPSSRWNEGLAMFLQWRLAEVLDGWSEWDQRLARTEENLKRTCNSPTPCGTVPMAAYGAHGLTDLSYVTGFALFDALYQTLGPKAFDRAYHEYFQRYRTRGAGAAELMAAFHRVDPASDRVFTEWFIGTSWYRRLSAGESLQQLVKSHPRR